MQSKALTLFSSVKSERGEGAGEEELEASRGGFVRLEERRHRHSINVHDEGAGAAGDAAGRHPEDPAKIILEGGYTQQQIFHVDQTAFY